MGDKPGFEFEAAGPELVPEISSFLAGIFQAPGSPNLNPGLLRWKYHDPGPEWTGSRSYVLRRGGRIVAHSGIWPIRLATPSGSVAAIQALDWAGARDVPGAGAALLHKLRGLAPVMITVGGSPDTRRVLPAMGFRLRGAAATYARVLRPWNQFRTRRFDGKRAIPRLLRNARWSRSHLAAAGDWTCHPSERPDSVLLEKFGSLAESWPESRHSAGFLSFMLRCPAARFLYFDLLHAGEARGYFLISQVLGQARLADLRILSATQSDWTSAFAVAAGAAAELAQSCELVANATVPPVRQALEQNNFRFRGDNPVFVFDPKNLLAGAENLQLGMLDEDSGYLSFPESPYCT